MSAGRRRPQRGLFASSLAPARLNLLRAMRSSRGADYLAGGLALGAFWVWTPITVLHVPVVLVAARAVRVSKMAAFAVVLASNPLTIVPIWALDFVVGTALTPGGNPASPLRNPTQLAAEPFTILRIGLHDYLTMCVGSLALGLVCSIVVFLLAHRWAAAVGHRRHVRRMRQAERLAAAPVAHHGPRSPAEAP